MDAPPPLLSVSKALSSQLQAIPHITQLVDDYLQPKTIDGAVYLDLPLMLRLYGDSRPWTVRAMDGAAARGRLDILQWLQSNRTEGCSSAAFTGAVTGGHLQVLRWLYRLYPELCHPAKEIVVAAVSGQVVMVEFLRSRLRSCEIELALEVAAAYGHVDVVESLVPGSFITSRAFAAAAAHGREEVVKLLLKHGCSDSLVGDQ
ncbi:hypothetical protein PHYBOEH_011464 [Phytophthora boehmeriae]|uniref:Ankyrin repeat-containing domain n=1 Tax=Phytophthora boehmeriae TaxID=109152 RepID=A0A8T1X2T4_9STRA|nr:hypothetical protein PHYBOEH_011464 [Phytophthora boehmeriae]